MTNGSKQSEHNTSRSQPKVSPRKRLEKLSDAFRSRYQHVIANQQYKMSHSFDGLALLSILGLICGLVSGGIIVLFRLAVDGQISFYFGGSFTTLNGFERLFLCTFGGLAIGLLLHISRLKPSQLGVVHVLERLDYHQGNLPAKNTLVQFVAATISLVSGHSVGREGPSIHLGAAGGSMLGRYLRIPNNSVRTLVGCGVAGAIAAAFNTPLAGVIFAMEVVLMEYTIIGFAPVILAAVSATTLSAYLIGDAPAFNIPEIVLGTPRELPLVVMLGAFVGCISVSFTRLTLFLSGFLSGQSIWLRTTLAGFITGMIAIFVPQIMGVGYESIDLVLLGEFAIGFTFALIFIKLFATAIAIGFGIPAGLIGPTLYIGACAGGFGGILANQFWGNDTTNIASIGFYVLLGMASMMAATLQAPLAALVFLLELSSNVGIILSGMVAVITAYLTTRVVFKKSSIYRMIMLNKGLDYRNNPVSQALRRVGVASVMERSFSQTKSKISLHEAQQLIQQEPSWILTIDDSEDQSTILPATDLARYLNELDSDRKQLSEGQIIDLMEIPAKRRQAGVTSMIATLQEAYETMQANELDILYVTGAHGKTKQTIFGVVTLEHVESSYRS